MPLTGFELFASDVDVPAVDGEHVMLSLLSGERKVRVRVTRNIALKLAHGIVAAVNAEPSAEIIPMP